MCPSCICGLEPQHHHGACLWVIPGHPRQLPLRFRTAAPSRPDLRVGHDRSRPPLSAERSRSTTTATPPGSAAASGRRFLCGLKLQHHHGLNPQRLAPFMGCLSLRSLTAAPSRRRERDGRGRRACFPMRFQTSTPSQDRLVRTVPAALRAFLCSNELQHHHGYSLDCYRRVGEDYRYGRKLRPHRGFPQAGPVVRDHHAVSAAPNRSTIAADTAAHLRCASRLYVCGSEAQHNYGTPYSSCRRSPMRSCLCGSAPQHHHSWGGSEAGDDRGPTGSAVSNRSTTTAACPAAPASRGCALLLRIRTAAPSRQRALRRGLVRAGPSLCGFTAAAPSRHRDHRGCPPRGRLPLRSPTAAPPRQRWLRLSPAVPGHLLCGHTPQHHHGVSAAATSVRQVDLPL